jgi:hypothetical protein
MNVSKLFSVLFQLLWAKTGLANKNWSLDRTEKKSLKIDLLGRFLVKIVGNH